jgi:hypothetical protein
LPSNDPERIKRAAQQLWDTYFSEESKFEINIGAETRQKLEEQIKDPDLHTFDEAQQVVLNLMTTDSLPKFLKSQSYRELTSR